MSQFEHAAGMAQSVLAEHGIEVGSEDAKEVVKTILLAIREPDTSMLAAADEADFLGGKDSRSVWQAMVDSILADGGAMPVKLS